MQTYIRTRAQLLTSIMLAFLAGMVSGAGLVYLGLALPGWLAP